MTMEHSSANHQTPPRSVPTSSGPAGLLLSRDLIFVSKIKGTATELGYPLMVADGNLQAKAMIEAHRPRVVLIDLAAGELAAPAALVAYRQLTGPNAWFVAFGAHIDANALIAAKAAGCHVVVPRSRFAAELPALLRRYFNEPAIHDG